MNRTDSNPGFSINTFLQILNVYSCISCIIRFVNPDSNFLSHLFYVSLCDVKRSINCERHNNCVLSISQAISNRKIPLFCPPFLWHVGLKINQRVVSSLHWGFIMTLTDNPLFTKTINTPTATFFKYMKDLALLFYPTITKCSTKNPYFSFIKNLILHLNRMEKMMLWFCMLKMSIFQKSMPLKRKISMFLICQYDFAIKGGPLIAINGKAMAKVRGPFHCNLIAFISAVVPGEG